MKRFAILFLLLGGVAFASSTTIIKSIDTINSPSGTLTLNAIASGLAYSTSGAMAAATVSAPLSFSAGTLSITLPLSVANSTIANQSLGTCTTSKTIDWSTGNSFTVTLTNGSACAFTYSNAVSGQTITLDLTQASSGGGTATATWSTTTKWSAGTAPTITTGNSATDTCTIKYNGTDYRGSCVQNFQ